MASLGFRHFSVKGTFSALKSLNGEVKKSFLHGGAIESFNNIPGPFSLPLIGDRWRYFVDFSIKRQHLTYWYLHFKFGNLVKENLFIGRVIVHVFEEYDMRKVYENAGPTPFRANNRVLEKYRRARPSLYKSAGLFASNGEEWFIFRRLFENIISDPRVAEENSAAFEDINDELVTRISRTMDYKCEVELRPELFKWAVENFGVVVLNRRLGCFAPENQMEMTELLQKTNDINEMISYSENSIPMWKYWPTPSYAKFEVAHDYVAKVIKKYFDEAVEEVKNNKNLENTLLGKMLAVKEASDRDVFTMVLDMFFAQVHKTLNVAEFALYNCAFNYLIQLGLQAELLEHLPTKTSEIADKLSRLTLLHAVLKESLRHDPVTVAIRTKLPTDLILSGYDVPARTLVYLQHHVACNLIDKNYYHTPQFLPDRWTGHYNKHSYMYLPFGFGLRKCLGRSLAERQVLLLLAKVIRCFRIEHHDLQNVLYIRTTAIETDSLVTNVPARPMRIRFLPLAAPKYT